MDIFRFSEKVPPYTTEPGKKILVMFKVIFPLNTLGYAEYFFFHIDFLIFQRCGNNVGLFPSVFFHLKGDSEFLKKTNHLLIA